MSTEIVNNIDLSRYGADDRATLEEALAMARDRGYDVRRFAACALVTETVIQRLYQGKYDGRADLVVADLRRWVVGERGNVLVPTDVTSQYRVVLDNCRRNSRMGVIVARNGRGKTLTADTWIAEQPAGTAYRIQCPSRCTRADVVRLIHRAMDGGRSATGRQTEPEQESSLYARLTARILLVVDEADYLLAARRRNSPLRLLQDLHDASRVPIVLMFRPSAWEELVAGRNAMDDEQFIGRLLYRCIVPPRYLRGEVESILKRYTAEITPAVRTIVRASLQRDDGGLRALVADLVQAKAFSDQEHVPFVQALAQSAAFRSRGGDWDEDRNPSF